MSTSTSRPPDRLRQPLRDERRNSGLSRVWDRMRAAMKRRNSDSAATDHDEAEHDTRRPFATAGPSTTPDNEVAIVADGPAIAPSSSATPRGSWGSLPRAIPMPEKFGDLVPDDDPDDDSEADVDEPALPMVCTSNQVNHARAQEIFAKYGLKYEPRFARTTDEPPPKIRRVARSLHIRVRWTCHECNAGFETQRTCIRCGHRRCHQCVRHPSRPASDAAEDPSANTAEQVIPQPERRAADVDMDEMAPSTNDDGALRLTSLEEALSEPLEKDTGDPDEAEDDADDDATHESLLRILQLSRSKQPRAGVDVVLKPKTQIIRRICHECQTQILPPNRTKCQACGHQRCSLCPRYPPKPEKWPHGSPGDEKPSSAENSTLQLSPTVQRVYRKPRQRVRYVCEHCHTTFVQRDTCDECGHGRCKECIRVPPRKPASVTAGPSTEPLQA